MTCIVGFIQDDKAYLGCDSCGSDGQRYGIIQDPKIFITGEFVFGCTTSFRMIDLLRYSLPLQRPFPDADIKKFMRTDFIAAARKCFKDGGMLTKKDEEESGGNFLVTYRSNLFEVQDDFSVLAPDAWGHSVGSGATAARGSLYTTRHKTDPYKRMLAALQSAEAIISSVRAPFYWTRPDGNIELMGA